MNNLVFLNYNIIKMKKLLFVTFCLVLLNCESESDSEMNQLEGKTYRISSYKIEAEVDLNSDGVFSNKLLSEQPFSCIANEFLTFTRFEVNPIQSNVLEVFVNEENSVNTQRVGCAIIDYFRFATYSIEDTMLTLFFDDNIFAIGFIEENTITFNLETSFFIQNYINSEGIVTDYNGGVTLVYVLE